MITLDNLSVFKKTIAQAEIKEILYFSQGNTTAVISFTMKTNLQSLIDLLCVLDTHEFGQTFFDHKREPHTIGVTAISEDSCKLNLYLSEEYELYTQVQNLVQNFNKNLPSDSIEEFKHVKTEDI